MTDGAAGMSVTTELVMSAAGAVLPARSVTEPAARVRTAVIEFAQPTTWMVATEPLVVTELIEQPEPVRLKSEVLTPARASEPESVKSNAAV